eukprot:CAMPEP_0117531398 /NCGR_PEP_ID=MMETSP0784-20121206/38838_1 /TAXON_ID=39447 /ORGANISM="" /LENGTH=188 /DNA_ID=CAMNT_0005327771 /DNA_START=30 /DNA_END=596 /DNA_ORIENTATION=-
MQYGSSSMEPHPRAASQRGSRKRRLAPDAEKYGYPYAIVWTPIHPITWILPFVGHMGVCDSEGTIHDWGGGSVNLDEMMFGNPTRYLILQKSDDSDDEEKRDWDSAIEEADMDFAQRMHCMICGSDCHSHVAVALNNMRYGGFRYWNKVILAAWVFFCGRHTSLLGFLATWLGTIVVVCLYFLFNMGS